MRECEREPCRRATPSARRDDRAAVVRSFERASQRRRSPAASLYCPWKAFHLDCKRVQTVFQIIKQSWKGWRSCRNHSRRRARALPGPRGQGRPGARVRERARAHAGCGARLTLQFFGGARSTGDANDLHPVRADAEAFLTAWGGAIRVDSRRPPLSLLVSWGMCTHHREARRHASRRHRATTVLQKSTGRLAIIARTIMPLTEGLLYP
ncbi:MAG: hypothetical protein Q6370_022420 [Candidatus Sigynarchaeota archaeon]